MDSLVEQLGGKPLRAAFHREFVPAHGRSANWYQPITETAYQIGLNNIHREMPAIRRYFAAKGLLGAGRKFRLRRLRKSRALRPCSAHTPAPLQILCDGVAFLLSRSAPWLDILSGLSTAPGGARGGRWAALSPAGTEEFATGQIRTAAENTTQQHEN